MSRKIVWWLRQLELFEYLGVIGSAVAVWLFLAYGSRLDEYVHQPGYHWDIVWMIAGIYAKFIPWAVLVSLVVAGILAWSIRSARGRVWQRYGIALRIFLAYCVLLIVFRIVNFYVPVIHPGLRDTAIQTIDRHLFGGKLVAEWLIPFIHPWLTHILTGAYVAWFWLLFATIGLLASHPSRAASEYVLASLLAFYAGYAGYLLVPVIGPGYTVHFSVPIGDIAPGFTTQTAQIARDCFPSLHTALSVVMGIYVWRYRRRFTWFYLPVLTLIIAATLYLRFHYGLDDIAGACLGVVAAGAAPALQGNWDRWRQRGDAAVGIVTTVGAGTLPSEN